MCKTCFCQRGSVQRGWQDQFLASGECLVLVKLALLTTLWECHSSTIPGSSGRSLRTHGRNSSQAKRAAICTWVSAMMASRKLGFCPMTVSDQACELRLLGEGLSACTRETGLVADSMGAILGLGKHEVPVLFTLLTTVSSPSRDKGEGWPSSGSSGPWAHAKSLGMSCEHSSKCSPSLGRGGH